MTRNRTTGPAVHTRDPARRRAVDLQVCLKIDPAVLVRCKASGLARTRPVRIGRCRWRVGGRVGGWAGEVVVVVIRLSVSLSMSLSVSISLSFPPSLPSSLPPSLPPSLARSLARSLLPSLPRSLAPSLARSLAPSLFPSLPPPHCPRSSLPFSCPSRVRSFGGGAGRWGRPGGTAPSVTRRWRRAATGGGGPWCAGRSCAGSSWCSWAWPAAARSGSTRGTRRLSRACRPKPSNPSPCTLRPAPCKLQARPARAIRADGAARAPSRPRAGPLLVDSNLRLGRQVLLLTGVWRLTSESTTSLSRP